MSDKNVYDNLPFLSPRDQLKFVIADRVDYLFAKKVLREKDVNCPVIMTPVGGLESEAARDMGPSGPSLGQGPSTAPQTNMGR